MAGAIEMSHLTLVETLMKALQGVGHAHTSTPPLACPVFLGRPESPGDQTSDEWLSDFDVFVRLCVVSEGERVVGRWWASLVGVRGRKCKGHPGEVRLDFRALASLLW